MAGIIIVGWDPQEGGQVSSVPMKGMMVRQSFATGASGSSYIYDYVGAIHPEGTTKDECLQFTANGETLCFHACELQPSFPSCAKGPHVQLLTPNPLSSFYLQLSLWPWNATAPVEG